LDVLEHIKIAVAYKLNGQSCTVFPADLNSLRNAEIEYEVLPGWQQDTSHIRKFSDLPQQAQNYVLRVEQLLGIPIRWVGVGAARDAMIFREDSK
jgi:adenylosuccinate synthase